MARPAYVAPVLRDPGVERGPFRVYLRADQKLIVVDTRGAPGRRTVAEHDSLGEATAEAERLAAIESTKS